MNPRYQGVAYIKQASQKVQNVKHNYPLYWMDGTRSELGMKAAK